LANSKSGNDISLNPTRSSSSSSNLLLSRLLDGHGLVLRQVSELVRRLRSVFVESLHSLGREVSVTLGDDAVDRLTALILHRGSRKRNFDVRLGRGRRTRQRLLGFVLGNPHATGLVGRGVASQQHLEAFSTE
jgi:hypothetical protein